MQLKYQQDFFVRPARLSDQGEVVALIEKYQNPEIASQINQEFAAILAKTPAFLQVALNSNGVLFGVVLVYEGGLQGLALNPNFQKKEVRDVLFRDLKVWVMEHTAGTLKVPPGLIVSKWKSFFSEAGVGFHSYSNEVKALSFLPKAV